MKPFSMGGEKSESLKAAGACWYPVADDLDAYDERGRWALLIDHNGHVSCISRRRTELNFGPHVGLIATRVLYPIRARSCSITSQTCRCRNVRASRCSGSSPSPSSNWRPRPDRPCDSLRLLCRLRSGCAGSPAQPRRRRRVCRCAPCGKPQPRRPALRMRVHVVDQIVCVLTFSADQTQTISGR